MTDKKLEEVLAKDIEWAEEAAHGEFKDRMLRLATAARQSQSARAQIVRETVEKCCDRLKRRENAHLRKVKDLRREGEDTLADGHESVAATLNVAQNLLRSLSPDKVGDEWTEIDFKDPSTWPIPGTEVLFIVHENDEDYAGILCAGKFNVFDYGNGQKMPEFSFPGRSTIASHWRPQPTKPIHVKE